MVRYEIYVYGKHLIVRIKPAQHLAPLTLMVTKKYHISYKRMPVRRYVSPLNIHMIYTGHQTSRAKSEKCEASGRQ